MWLVGWLGWNYYCQITAKLRPLARSNPGFLVTQIAAYCSLPDWCLLLAQIAVSVYFSHTLHYYHIDAWHTRLVYSGIYLIYYDLSRKTPLHNRQYTGFG